MGESDMESEEKEKNKPQTGNVHKYFLFMALYFCHASKQKQMILSKQFCGNRVKISDRNF